MKTSAKYFRPVVGPWAGNMSQNGQKPTSLMMSLTKKRNPKQKIVFIAN